MEIQHESHSLRRMSARTRKKSETYEMMMLIENLEQPFIGDLIYNQTISKEHPADTATISFKTSFENSRGQGENEVATSVQITDSWSGEGHHDFVPVPTEDPETFHALTSETQSQMAASHTLSNNEYIERRRARNRKSRQRAKIRRRYKNAKVKPVTRDEGESK